jgi:hypothetical protein
MEVSNGGRHADGFFFFSVVLQLNVKQYARQCSGLLLVKSSLVV